MSELQIKEVMNEQPMSRYQWFIVGICLFLYIIDGFDFMVMAYVASSIGAELSLTSTHIGALISAGLVGMTVGSIFVAPLADRIGRKNLVIISLILCATSMVAATFVRSAFELGICRFITGIGIGGIQISCMVLATEYSSKRLKSFSVGLLSAGYGLGATLGGLLAVYLIGSFGWRYVFLFGGIATFVGLLLSIRYLPESIDYLLYKQPKQALEKLNMIAKKMGHQIMENLPAQALKPTGKSTIKKIFNEKYLMQTLILWFSMFFILFGFYFVMGWTPKIIASSGLGNESGVTIGMMISAGGMIGALALGVLSTKFRVFHVQVFFLCATALSVFIFVNSTATPNLLILSAIILGLFINGCLAGIYSISTGIYEADVRSTGVGFATGIGRFGGISSPIIAGYFLDQGMAPLSLYGLFSVIFIIAAIGIFSLSRMNAKAEKKFQAQPAEA